MSKIPDEIKRGMELLDREVPGWRKRINPNLLNLAHCKQCILGQVFGDFAAGKRAIYLVDDNPERYGFDCHPINYHLLTSAWKEALQVKSE